MLLQKPKETPYISVFKLVTGEEIIAKVTKEDHNEISISSPLQMVMGQRGAQFAPWMMMASPNEGITISKDRIVAKTSPVAELESQYESITTGIALPQKSSILTA